MKIKFGILAKLFAWYLLACLIFYGTILSLFVHIQTLGKISEDIANRNYRIATASKKMIDTLWWMAENQKKYDLLKKEEYKEYFATGQKEYASQPVSKSCGSVPAAMVKTPGTVFTRNTRSSSHPSARNRPTPNIRMFPGSRKI